TSRVHTAVKIAPAYNQPVLHVLDASRAVGVVGKLKSPEQHGGLVEENRQEQERTREAHRAPSRQPLLSLAEARRRKPAVVWSEVAIPRPSFAGVRVFNPVPLAEIVPYIDWTPFFHTWELRGIYPKIFEQEGVGARARELFNDAQHLLKRMVEEKL